MSVNCHSIAAVLDRNLNALDSKRNALSIFVLKKGGDSPERAVASASAGAPAGERFRRSRRLSVLLDASGCLFSGALALTTLWKSDRSSSSDR